jgi:hypothetical protein
MMTILSFIAIPTKYYLGLVRLKEKTILFICNECIYHMIKMTKLKLLQSFHCIIQQLEFFEHRKMKVNKKFLFLYESKQ